MRSLYIDCSMGAAGDMLMASLFELLPEKEDFLRKMNSLAIPGVRVEAEKKKSCGITGTHMQVTVDGEEEGEHHHHEHHHHEHHHHSDGEQETGHHHHEGENSSHHHEGHCH
ncbi:MAG: nickel insertion protein, partial [Anaerovoracaceae bacterium]